MKGRKARFAQSSSGLLSLGYTPFIIVLLLLLFLPQSSIVGQSDPEYYEISVNLDIQRVGGTEVDAVIKGKEIYLAITHLLMLLGEFGIHFGSH